MTITSTDYDFKELRAKGGKSTSPAYSSKAVTLGSGSFARYVALQKDANDVYTLYSSSSEEVENEAITLSEVKSQVTNESAEVTAEHTATTAHPNIANLSVKSADGETTYTVETDYTFNATTGVITLVETGSAYSQTSLKVAYKWLKNYKYELAKTAESESLVIKDGETTFEVETDYTLGSDAKTLTVPLTSGIVSASAPKASYTHFISSGTPCALLLHDVGSNDCRVQAVYESGIFHSSYIPNYDAVVGAMTNFSFVTP